MAPEQERTRLSRHIPPEIIEEILLNLPVKSLLRFSASSKSLNSLLHDSRFIRKHKRRSVLLRRETIRISHRRLSSTDPHTRGRPNLSLSLPSLTTEPIFIPFLNQIPKPTEVINLYTMCDVMWCVGQDEGSLFLWNHSIRSYRKLPPPSDLHRSLLGLGFDLSSDDYKLLKINLSHDSKFNELYSLRSDSWKEIEHFPQVSSGHKFTSLVAVDGVFNCVVDRIASPYTLSIMTFDLSTEKYGVVAPPPFAPPPTSRDRVKLTVFEEKLCVFVNYKTTSTGRFVLWMMQEYGVEKSWTKMFEIEYKKILPLITEWSSEENEENMRNMKVTPLNLYDNGEVYIRVSNGKDATVIVHVDEKSIPRNVHHCCSSNKCISDQQPYVESLISPGAFC